MQPILAAQRAATTAGKLLLRRFRYPHRTDAHAKSAHELVTAADQASNLIIQRTLRHAFPAIGFLSEEGNNRPGKLRWVVDPLDGTTNFVLHVPFFGVSIALMDGNDVLFGIITCPPTGERFIAARGQGAERNGHPLRMIKPRPLREAIIGYGYSHSLPSLLSSFAMAKQISIHTRSVRHAGSTALDLAYVAAGRLDAIVIAGPINLWDVAAGVAIVRESGGVVEDAKQKSWLPSSRDLYAGSKVILNRVRKCTR
jgi:myo-inositol-1(or 4)-monophosphatase